MTTPVQDYSPADAATPEARAKHHKTRKPEGAGDQPPWHEDPDILERLEQRGRWERAGMSRLAIMKLLDISHDTYALDSHRMKDLAKMVAGKSVSARINDLSAVLMASMKANMRIMEDPSADQSAAVQATRANAVLAKEYRELHRLATPLAGDGQLGSGQTVVGQQNNLIVNVSSDDLLNGIENRWKQFQGEMAAIDLSEQAERKYFGVDNIIPVGLAAGARDGEEADPDDDDDY